MSSHANPSPRRRVSKTADYFAKTANGDYHCIVCKDHTPSRKFIIKKDKTGSTSRLWKHLKKAHAAIHQRIRHDMGQSSVADVFTNVSIPKQDFTGITADHTVERFLCLICRTDISLDLVESPELKKWITYFAERDVNLPSAETVLAAAFKKFKEWKSSLCQLLEPVRKVSLMLDSWSPKHEVPILGITVHWVDDTWALCERVLGVKEMVGHLTGDDVAELLIQTLEDFSLMDKVHVITTNSASNNSRMVASLAKALKDIETTLNKECHMPCLADVINLVVQEGLKQLGILPAPSMSEVVDEFEGTASPTKSSKVSLETSISMLGTLVGRLRLAIIASAGSLEMMDLYKGLCKELGVPDKKFLVLDFATNWNSTYEMLVAAWRKRQVLDKMSSIAMNMTKNYFSFTTDEWELIKLFICALLPFHYCIELLSKSKAISVSTILRILEVLLSMMASYIYNLDKIPSNALDSMWSAEQLATLKGAYMMMKEKLVDFDKSLKRSPSYVIAAALDPQMKLSDTLSVEQVFVYDHLLRFAKEVEDNTTSNQNATAEETDMNSIIQSFFNGTLPEGFNLIETALECSLSKTNRVKRSVRDELDEYFREARVDDDSLNWWRQMGSLRFLQLALLAKEFLSISMGSTSFKRMFAPRLSTVPYKIGSLDKESASVLMTLKCWTWEEHTEEDEQSDSELDEVGSLDQESASVLMTLKCWTWEDNAQEHMEEDEQLDSKHDEDD